MFEGQSGKDLMIKQGYVPQTCTLPAEFAGTLIYDEVLKGRSPCWGCNADRSVCHGQPFIPKGQENRVQDQRPPSENVVTNDPRKPLNIAGLDLGQTTDPSALCICTRYAKNTNPFVEVVEKEAPVVAPGHSLADLKPVDQLPKKPEDGSLTRNIEKFKAGDAAFDYDLPAAPENPLWQGMKRYYACRTLKRWPIGTNYLDIVSSIKYLDRKMDNMILVVDNTGVGRPVVDLFRRARLRCRVVPVTITSGLTARLQVNEDKQTGEFRVPKVELISNIQVILQSKRIRFIEGMEEAEVLMNELREFRFKITEALNETYGAREGEHDDLVLALAIALWFGERAPMRLKAW